MARTFRWRRILETGRFATTRELAAAEKINASSVSRILRLTLLAPAVVKSIPDGRQAVGVALPVLMAGVEGGGGRQDKHRAVAIDGLDDT